MVASHALAGPRVDRAGGLRTTTQSATIDNSAYIDTDDLFMFVTNTGTFGRDLDNVFGFDYGTFFPFEEIDSIAFGPDTVGPLYVAGLWVSGVDASTGDTVMAIGEYATEYVPGPMAYGTFQADNPAFRVYKLHADSLESNPNSDYTAWPVNQGAPLDRHGKPLMLGTQYLWTVFNDADPAQHVGRVDAGETDPVGIEIRRATWGDPDYWYGATGDVYILYTVFNRGYRSLENTYLTFWVDPDIGNTKDDLVGCDTALQSMFCYNNGLYYDSVYGDDPPAIGFRLLAGPVIPDNTAMALVGPYVAAGVRNLKVKSFNSYVNGWDPDNYQETYGLQQGLDKNGDPYYYNGDLLSHKFSGDPVAATGDLDQSPGDKRMMATFGPLTMQPGDSQCVFIKMAVVSPDQFGTHTLETLRQHLNQNPHRLLGFDTAPVDSLQGPPYDGTVAILIGNLETGESVENIRPQSIALVGPSSPLSPDSTVVMDSVAGHDGPVLKAYFDKQSVFDQYPDSRLLARVRYTMALNSDRQGYLWGGEMYLQRVLMGDVTQDGTLTLADVTYLVNYVFLGGPAPPLPAAADLKCDGTGDLTLTDITRLVNLIFLDGSEPVICPYWLGP